MNIKVDFVPTDEDEDLPDIAAIRSSQKRGRMRVLTRSTPEEDDENDDDEDDEEQPISSPLKRRRRAPSHDDNDDEEESIAKKPKVTRNTRQEQHRQRKPRLTAHQKAIEKVKRQRAGEKSPELEEEESDSEEEHHRGIYDSDSDLEALSEFEDDDEEDEEEEIEKVRRSLRPDNRNQYDSDFIVEDDEIGVPAEIHDIPLQFTHNAHKHLKEHFKDAVEWLVQKKVR